MRQVREAGGIPLVKTNVPQNLGNYECSNPLWGTTKNPYDAKYTSGGSSGGEGALLAMGGSAIGWGSDIGGSIRIPSHFCGLYSLKPGSGRISLSGTVGEQFSRINTIHTGHTNHSLRRSKSRVQKYPNRARTHGKNSRRHRDRVPRGVWKICKPLFSACPISRGQARTEAQVWLLLQRWNGSNHPCLFPCCVRNDRGTAEAGARMRRV